MRRLTERQAWLLLGRAFKKGNGEDRERAIVCGLAVRGLCISIGRLLAKKRIAKDVASAMDARMNENEPDHSGLLWWWPPGTAGLRRRTAFCNRMAEQCRKEKKR